MSLILWGVTTGDFILSCLPNVKGGIGGLFEVLGQWVVIGALGFITALGLLTGLSRRRSPKLRVGYYSSTGLWWFWAAFISVSDTARSGAWVSYVGLSLTGFALAFRTANQHHEPGDIGLTLDRPEYL